MLVEICATVIQVKSEDVCDEMIVIGRGSALIVCTPLLFGSFFRLQLFFFAFLQVLCGSSAITTARRDKNDSLLERANSKYYQHHCLVSAEGHLLHR
jgi:hypothetical protein